MVVYYSMGGLGNQLFQYATARRLALEAGVEVAVDASWHARTFPDTTPRPFALDALSVKVRALTPSEGAWARWARHPVLGRIPLTPWTVRRERGFAFEPSLLRCGDRTYLYGYWQSPRYFEDARHALLAELLPVAPPSEADRRILDAMGRCDSVLVHVRRGDYVTLGAAAAYHGTCSIEYYRAAYDVVARSVRSPVLFVFSDDPAWVRENLRLPAPMVYVDHNPPEQGHQDLRLMASCRHAILANSSFSWWGAWLGTAGDKVVVAPRRWFADGRPTPDLLPPSWHVV
jgi:hypothetical protein